MKTIGLKVLVEVQKIEKPVEKVNGLTLSMDNDLSYDICKVSSIGCEIFERYGDILSEGDTVYIPKNCGFKIEEAGVDYRVINVNDILVKL